MPKNMMKIPMIAPTNLISPLYISGILGNVLDDFSSDTGKKPINIVRLNKGELVMVHSVQ